MTLKMILPDSLKNRLIVSILFILIILLTPLAYCYAENIRIGVLANKGTDDAIRRWNITAVYLQNRITNYTFSIVPLSFEQIEPAVRNGNIDFLISNPAIYVEMEALYGVSRIVTLIDNGLTLFGGVIFCRSDRQDIQKINDLKRKSFMAVDKTSLGGWIMALSELKQHGIDPYRDFAPMLFGGSHKSVVYAVRDGKVDAGTVRTDTLERLAKNEGLDLSVFRIINKKNYEGFPLLVSTALYPEWPLAKLKHTPVELAKRVAVELLSMPADSPANRAAGIGGWTIPLDYHSVHEVMKELRVSPYQEYGRVTIRQVIRQYWHWLLLALIVLLIMGAALMVIYKINRKLARTSLQRQQAEKTIREQRQIFELILEQTLAGYWYRDLRDGTGYFSPTFKKMFGYEDHEMPNEPLMWQELIFTEDIPGVLELLRQHIESHGEVHFYNEVRYRHKNGSTVWVICTGKVIEWDDQGQPVRLVGCHVDITARKQAEEALRKSEEKYRAIFNNSQAGVYRTRISDGKMLEANPKLAQMFGYQNCEEFIKDFFVPAHYVDPGARESMLAALREKGELNNYEACFFRRDNSIFWLSFSIRILPEDDFLEGVAIDSTERKQAEEALHESEQKYRLLVTDVPAIVYRGYADWGVEFFNDKIEELSGYPLEDFQSQKIKWSDLILAEDVGQAKEIFLKALKSTRAYVREYRIRAKNGEVRWLRERGRIACDPQGRIDQVTGVFSDITEQHNLAQELEQLRQQQEMILTAAGEGIFGLNRQGEITFANPAATAMIGYEPGELVGRSMHDLIHHTREDGAQHLREDCPLLAALQSGETRQVDDDFFWRPDGQGFPVEYVAAPVMDRGQPVGTVVVFRDITRRRRDEAALARVNDHLRRLVAETEERHRTVSLLKDMVDVLQSCHTTEEAYATISLYATKLFPEDSGALYLLDTAQNYFAAVAAWGEAPPATAVFAPDDCWSVRRHRLHLVTASQPELPCRHLTDSWSGDYLCVPMIVQGGAPGVLHVRLSPPMTPGRTAEDLKTRAESRLQLAVSVAEHLGLSLANLNLQETLRQQAIRDPLTGLFNRRYLEETLDRELVRARRENAPVGVIMMDLDHFKQFNDAFGHGGGDILLRELGQLIQRRIREEDVPCRWGGEEFLLIMPGASMDIVRARAEEIRQDVKQLRVEDRGKSLGPITISLGAATFPEHGATGEEIIRAADAALYRAKHEGRDRVVEANGDSA